MSREPCVPGEELLILIPKAKPEGIREASLKAWSLLPELESGVLGFEWVDAKLSTL